MRLPGLVVVCGALSAAIGCSIDEDAYTTRLAVAECRTMERCGLGFFESEFGDIDGCVDEVAHDLDALAEDLFEDCEYDEREASRCISRIRGMACEDWARGDDEDACDLVYDCRE